MPVHQCMPAARWLPACIPTLASKMASMILPASDHSCCLQMTQKQGALAELQSQVAAVGRSSEGNVEQIVALQGALAGLQSERLDLQRADLSGRLAVLQDIAAQASLTTTAKVPHLPHSLLQISSRSSALQTALGP